jgi:hypothetical protein
VCRQPEPGDVAVGGPLETGDDIRAELRLEEVRVRFCGRRYSSTDRRRRIGVTSVTSPSLASNTGKSPVCSASRAMRTVSWDAVPQPSGQGTRTCR